MDFIRKFSASRSNQKLSYHSISQRRPIINPRLDLIASMK